MRDFRYFPQKIFIEKSCVDLPLTQSILNNLGKIPVEILHDSSGLLRHSQNTVKGIKDGKKYLLIARQKGSFIKPCPCTPQYIGCNYFTINMVLNCPLDCSYCILQDYLSNPLITVFANLEDLWRELDVFLNMERQSYLRIGTGELGDSLVLDHITENSKDLISYFREKSRTFLELKTKSVEVDNILSQEPAENVVISWSLNSFRIAEEEESGVPPVEERIEAARRVSEKGFQVGFHFDPLIRYPGWEQDYAEVIQMMLKEVKPVRIRWISLGSLRFPPSMKQIIKYRFPRTKIIYEEFIKGRDGKFRYFRPLRLELYRKIIKILRECGAEEVPLYLCMENEVIWKMVMGWVPRRKEDVENFLSP